MYENQKLHKYSQNMKYPIGIQSFDQIITEGYVYVDKTALVHSLVTEGKIYFLSRPRRFGKSLLISTLKNYFLGKKELFKGLAIDKLEKEWKVYPVFHIDFNGANFAKRGALEGVLNDYLSTWEDMYNIINKDSELEPGIRFRKILEAAHLSTGIRAVVLIDEYDKPVLDVLDEDSSVEENNRNVLKGFYSSFKSADEHLQFVFLTGVTKFSQVSVFSGFNQPNDISMNFKYDTICGISQDELDEYFYSSISEMATINGCDINKIKYELKNRYDGYHFSSKMIDVYNPFSLLCAFGSMEIYDYWFQSGTPSYLVKLLKHSNENINEITGKYYPRERFIDYKADVQMPLPMIYQSGYLTIKKYDPERNRFMLDFPNTEVKNGFLTLAASEYFGYSENVSSWINDIVDALENGNIDLLGRMFTSFLASIPYSMRRKENEREKERYFHYTFYLIMRLISIYTIYTEKEQSQGRVDCIVETSSYIYIFEFKLNGNAKEALNQIEKKGYAKEYNCDKRIIYKIGVVFSSETGTIEDWVWTQDGN